MRAAPLLLILAGTLALGACGKKPGQFFDTPGTGTAKIYPDPAYDPRPSLPKAERKPDARQPSTGDRAMDRDPTDPLDRALDQIISPDNSGRLP